MKIYSKSFLLLALPFLAPSFAFALDNAANVMSAKDTLSQLHATNQAEITFGTMAKQKGQSKDVRNFGEKLVKDHAAADKKVAKIAQKESIVLSEPKMTTEQKDLQGKLEKATGKNFDKLFVSAMNSDHGKEVQKLQTAKIENEEVRDLVEDILPTLEKHKEIAAKLEKDQY